MIKFDPTSLCGTVECDEAWTAGRWRRPWLGIGNYIADKGIIRVLIQCGGKVSLEVIDGPDQKARHGFIKKPTAPET
jgi:hypothetical protein